MKKYNHYINAELELIDRVLNEPDYTTKTTFERVCEGFILTNPMNNYNEHSNYEYAEEFFQWILTGQTRLSEKLVALNPWVQRFVSNTGLPESFSASYGWKIKKQLDIMLDELIRNGESRRAYINILYPDDQIIIPAKTTHEYPCTIGLQFFIRDGFLHMIVNMRSNNVYSVMPYDVYNFTRLQIHVCNLLQVNPGWYYHQINNAHIYRGDARRLNSKT